VSVERIPASWSLVEVMDRILDKGIVIERRKDVLVSLILGIQILVLEERVAVVSVDTYLKYAEEVGLIPLERPHHVTEYVARGREITELPPWA